MWEICLKRIINLLECTFNGTKKLGIFRESARATSVAQAKTLFDTLGDAMFDTEEWHNLMDDSHNAVNLLATLAKYVVKKQSLFLKTPTREEFLRLVKKHSALGDLFAFFGKIASNEKITGMGCENLGKMWAPVFQPDVGDDFQLMMKNVEVITAILNSIIRDEVSALVQQGEPMETEILHQSSGVDLHHPSPPTVRSEYNNNSESFVLLSKHASSDSVINVPSTPPSSIQSRTTESEIVKKSTSSPATTTPQLRCQTPPSRHKQIVIPKIPHILDFELAKSQVTLSRLQSALPIRVVVHEEKSKWAPNKPWQPCASGVLPNTTTGSVGRTRVRTLSRSVASQQSKKY
eukprot:PhF_6_TR4164/c0_g1_i1/m.5593